MFVKQPTIALKSDGTKVPYEVGKGFKLGIGTYYIDVGMPDPEAFSVHCTWDGALVATSLQYQGSNLGAFKSGTNPMNDSDSPADVALNDSTAGNWIAPDPNTTYIATGTGITVTGTSAAIAGGTANGTVFALKNAMRRGRMAVVTTTGGYFRCTPHGKQA